MKTSEFSILRFFKPYKPLKCNANVLDFMQQQIALLRDTNRFGTALNYEKTMKNFSEFLGGADIPFSAITELLIANYNTFLIKRGMAFVDIAYLKKENIENGMINFARRKTGQLLSVRIEPCIQTIIERYSSYSAIYVFPILISTDAEQSYNEYQIAINNYNRLLGKLSKMLPEACKLTSYTSRHSWATSARNHNVPISFISQGMGHTSEQTTRIYLTMLENSVIDDANQGIIKALLE